MWRITWWKISRYYRKSCSLYRWYDWFNEKDEFREKCGDICYQNPDENKYYGKTGEEVDELTYQKECGNNICQAYPDGTYSDPEGKTTTKEDYELKCKSHSCEKVEGNYFDKDGNIVTEEQYNKDCPNGENPKTGTSLPVITLLIMLACGVGLLVLTKKTNRFMN